MTSTFFSLGRLFACVGGSLLATQLLTSVGAASVNDERIQSLAASASLSVQVTPATTIFLNGGAPGVLTASPQITVTGGTAPYRYTWTPPAGARAAVANASAANPAISATVNWGDNFTETWTVTVTDPAGATGTGSATVNFFSPSADTVPDAANRVPIQGRITSYTLTTALPVGQTTYPIQIYVPPDYLATSDPLPVIYATDAGPLNTAPAYAWQFFDMLRIIEAQHLRIIVVGLGGYETRNTDYLLPGADAFYAFITTEVIPFVETRYDIDPDARVLSGHSYGGLFAGTVFMKEHPGSRFFSNYIALDGSFWVNPAQNVTLEQALYSATGGSLPNLALVLSSATGGNNSSVTTFHEQLKAFNFQGLQLARVPNFNTSHTQMFDEAFAASLELISINLPGASTPPVITVQPQNVTVATGSVFNLQVTAIGGGLAYQWLKNGSAITGATAATYSVSSAASTDAGAYTVTVKNRAGNVTSNTTTVTVNPPAPTPATPSPSGSSSISGGGNGGGGALGPDFFVVLALLALIRRRAGQPI